MIGRENDIGVGAVLKLAADQLKLPSLAQSAIHGTQSADQIAGGIIMASQTGFVEKNGAYDQVFAEAEAFRRNVSAAEEAFKKQQFRSAHRFYGEAMKVAPPRRPRDSTSTITSYQATSRTRFQAMVQGSEIYWIDVTLSSFLTWMRG
ncbi:hypothetical protein ASG19_07140 [Rhizobium sp. Leaf306]|nr:hypothetical protein ASG19_07140 [Rhizobium sp. Leaf306]